MHFLAFLVITSALSGWLPGIKANEGGEVACRDAEGRYVDWYYLYKLPRHYSSSTKSSSSKSAAASGMRYVYVTSRESAAWRFATTNIDETASMPALTLQPLFDNSSILVIAYNDEFPNGTTVATGGHTKGVVATDGVTGVWFVHSVPKFPAIPTYEYPFTGAHYGQSLLCLSLSAAAMHTVGNQLLYNEPNIYFSRLPARLHGEFPSLEMAMSGHRKTAAPYQSAADIFTIAGQRFVSFAKGSKYGRELYADFVAPALDVNLLVESWRDGAGNLPSNCSSSDRVYNIASIEEKQLDVSFTTTTDHSKWAVSQKTGFKLWRWRIGGADWICVGDINRQKHQLYRGGGTVCQKHSQVVQLYRDLVASYDPCQN